MLDWLVLEPGSRLSLIWLGSAALIASYMQSDCSYCDLGCVDSARERMLVLVVVVVDVVLAWMAMVCVVCYD